MREVTAVELSERLRADDAPLLLDVRELWELEAARIEGVMHIPMGEVPAALGALPRDREIVVICHHGGRSFTIALLLERAGFRAANLAGGIDAWHRDVDPSVPAY